MTNLLLALLIFTVAATGTLIAVQIDDLQQTVRMVDVAVP